MTWKASGGNAVDAAQLPLVSGALSWRRRNRSRWPAPRGHHHAIHQCLVTERNRLQASGAERERIGQFTETYRGVCAIEYSAYPRGTDSRATSRDSWGLFCNRTFWSRASAQGVATENPAYPPSASRIACGDCGGPQLPDGNRPVAFSLEIATRQQSGTAGCHPCGHRPRSIDLRPKHPVRRFPLVTCGASRRSPMLPPQGPGHGTYRSARQTLKCQHCSGSGHTRIPSRPLRYSRSMALIAASTSEWLVPFCDWNSLKAGMAPRAVAPMFPRALTARLPVRGSLRAC